MIDWAAIGRRALHPTKVAILEYLDADEPAVLSPKQMSDALGIPLGDVSYHVKGLVDLGVIELVRTRPVRGAVEHFYTLREGS